MTDSVYLYPKTLCPTGQCGNSYPIPQGKSGSPIQTNLSVENCKVSPYFDCYSKVLLKNQLQPQDTQGWYDLNPQAYTDKISPDFNRVACKTASTCPQPSYISMDPRLYDSPRADYLPLDRPPMNGDVRLKDVYNEEWDGYGQGFQPYNQIRDGQITYYIDKSIQSPFFKPVWSEPAEEELILYQDPMGAMKSEANRRPLVNTENPVTATTASYPYCLSFIQDSATQREDLMSYQQRKNNQEKWTVRWT